MNSLCGRFSCKYVCQYVLAIILLLAAVTGKANQGSEKTQLIEGTVLFTEGKPGLALPIIEPAYISWRSSFNHCDEFVPGGNLLFYPHAGDKNFYDSVFNTILHVAVGYDEVDFIFTV